MTRMTPSLDLVHFDMRGYESGGEPQPGHLRTWHSPDGDGVGLYLFPLEPDLPRASSRAVLAAYYAGQAEQVGGGLVDLDVLVLSGVATVRVLLKVPQRPSGLTYLGSITIPFASSSYVIKVQCPERGGTGMREAVLLNERLAAGDVPVLAGGRMQLPGWNPDAAEHDARFPEHPASRARRVLERVRTSLVVEPALAACEPFPLPRD
jgi:hypothetical protein